MTMSTSVSRTNRASICHWFMPTPIGPDDPLVAQLGQRRVGLGDGLVAVVVRVVDQHDVDPVEAEPLQALLQRPPYAVGEKSQTRRRWRARRTPRVGGPARAGGHEQAADLGGQHVAVAAGRAAAAEPPLGDRPSP